jgi:3',5'-cyclic AMP phosphodiesterase CpdA
MPRPRDFGVFTANAPADRAWRIAHLSDIHVVGERYGFRIESGRAGPRGNERLNRLLALLDVIHAKNPLDIILITGDMTDAGRSAE